MHQLIKNALKKLEERYTFISILSVCHHCLFVPDFFFSFPAIFPFPMTSWLSKISISLLCTLKCFTAGVLGFSGNPVRDSSSGGAQRYRSSVTWKTHISPTATYWPACYDQGMRKPALLEMGPWWLPLQHYHPCKKVGYCTHRAELYIWTRFWHRVSQKGVLLYQPCSPVPSGQTHFPSFTWCNL